MQQLTIGEAARHAGMNASALRYYERVGLLPKPPRINGQRRYSSDVLTQLTIVRMAQEAGFSIDEIRMLVSGFPDGTPAAARWRELAHRKLPELDAMISRLQTMRQVLEESLECNCLTLAACAEIGWDAGQERAIVS